MFNEEQMEFIQEYFLKQTMDQFQKKIEKVKNEKELIGRRISDISVGFKDGNIVFKNLEASDSMSSADADTDIESDNESGDELGAGESDTE